MPRPRPNVLRIRLIRIRGPQLLFRCEPPFMPVMENHPADPFPRQVDLASPTIRFNEIPARRHHHHHPRFSTCGPVSTSFLFRVSARHFSSSCQHGALVRPSYLGSPPLSRRGSGFPLWAGFWIYSFVAFLPPFLHSCLAIAP